MEKARWAQAEAAASQADLHAFFQALYETIFSTPEQFGLPVSEDVFYLVDHSKEGLNKTDIKKILDKPRALIEEGHPFPEPDRRYWRRRVNRHVRKARRVRTLLLPDYLDWNKTAPAPPLPQEIVTKTADKYREALFRLTGIRL